MIEVMKFVSRPIGENAYLFFQEESKRAVAVDPSYNSEAMIRYLGEEGMAVEAILLTHGHFDHIAGIDALRGHGRARLPARGDADMPENPEKNLSVITDRLLRLKPADVLLKGGGENRAGGYGDRGAAHAGAYARGTCYLAEDLMFSGDTLFYLSIGRTDLPGSDDQQMKESLKELCMLQKEYVVYPGHGQSTSLGFEVQNNPDLGDEMVYLATNTPDYYAELCDEVRFFLDERKIPLVAEVQAGYTVWHEMTRGPERFCHTCILFLDGEELCRYAFETKACPRERGRRGSSIRKFASGARRFLYFAA